jgi:catechol 2,3-dioxygenase-like lactoylglutathione lyase family enzyme
MGLPVRISAVTLACRDIERLAAFYRQFGWPEAPTSVPEHVVFQGENGVILGLYSHATFDRLLGRVGDDWSRGFSLTIHCADEQEVRSAHSVLAEFDDVLELEEPSRSGWGYGFGFRDPEGNLWGVAFKYGSEFDHRGGFFYP